MLGASLQASSQPHREYSIYVYIYIYIWRERERDIYIYIYIYIYQIYQLLLSGAVSKV